MNISHIRSLSQQLLAPQFSSAHDVVCWMGFMQAQDYNSFSWAVGVRMKNPSYKKFRMEFDEGRIIRTHLFRNTVQLVAAEDLAWMQTLYYDRVMNTERSWMKKHIDVDDPLYTELCQKIVTLLEKEHQLTKSQLKERLGAKYQLNDLVLSHLLRRLEYEGIVCSGPIIGNYPTFALQEERVKQRVILDREEALATLARMYFQSHAPATLDDFVWWSGLRKTECRQAIEAIKKELVTKKYKSKTYYLHEQARTRGFRSGHAQLLPPYDEYLIGYKDRSHVLSPEYSHRAHNKIGIFWPVILVDGTIIGNWNSRFQYTWFENDETLLTEQAKERYLKFKNKV